MKLKQFTPLLAGAIAIIVTVIPGIAQAQTVNLPTELFPVLSGVELTQQQQEQLSQIRLSTRSQLENILTTDQHEQLITNLEQGEGLLAAFSAMNLSADQQSQLRKVFQSTRSQLRSIITPEQRNQILSNLRSKWVNSPNSLDLQGR